MSSKTNALHHYLCFAMGLSPIILGCSPPDLDGDGSVADVDCQDDNAAIHPHAIEVCDGIDNNCDGIVDVDATDQNTFYADVDGDGFGDPLAPIQACLVPKGAVSNASDCDPNHANVYPNAWEDPKDGKDNDCDGRIDEMSCAEAPEPRRYSSLFDGPKSWMFCTPPTESEACAPARDVRPRRLIQTHTYRKSLDSNAMAMAKHIQWRVRSEVCGPVARRPLACCYVFTLDATMPFRTKELEDDGGVVTGAAPKAVHGRPLIVDGVTRVSGSMPRKDWIRAITPLKDALTQAQRKALGRRWLEAARMEHASVASFAKCTLDLMALGAPRDLIEGAVDAQQDEIRHTAACFSLAAQYFGVSSLGPGPLALEGLYSGGVTLESVLIQTIRDGCVNETLAAAEAIWLAQRTQVPHVRQILEDIAKEEAKHAALAWRFVRWALDQNPDLAASLQQTMAVLREVYATPGPEDEEDLWMAAYGCMPSQEAHRCAQRTWTSVITPCSESVLAAVRLEVA